MFVVGELREVTPVFVNVWVVPTELIEMPEPENVCVAPVRPLREIIAADNLELSCV